MKTNPKITAGKYKNTTLKVPKSARPITARMKRSIFDTIESSFDITKLSIADLFAGSASIGIEALSRGAKYVFFLDNSKESIYFIKNNLDDLKVESKRFDVKKGYFKTFTNNSPKKFDIVFLDPPFPSIERVRFDKLENIMNSESISILKAPAWFSKKFNDKYSKQFEIIFEKKFGKNIVLYFTKR